MFQLHISLFLEPLIFLAKPTSVDSYSLRNRSRLAPVAIPACDRMFCVVVGREVSYMGRHTFPGHSFAWAAVCHDVSLI